MTPRAAPAASEPEQSAWAPAHPFVESVQRRVLDAPPPAPPARRRRERIEDDRPLRIEEEPAADYARAPRSYRLLVALALALFCFTVLTWIYLFDQEQPSEETLQWRPQVDTAAGVQSQRRLGAVLATLVPAPSVLLLQTPPSKWDTPTLSDWVARNQTALRNLTDLLEDADWRPQHVTWYASDLGVHSNWVPLGVLKQAEAAYFERRGEELTAFTAAMDLAELARRLEDLRAWPSYFERARDLHARACQTLAELLAVTRLPSAALEASQADFQACMPDEERVRAALTAFYIHEKKMLLGLRSGEPSNTLPASAMESRPGRLFFKPRETLQLFLDTFRDLRDLTLQSPYTRASQITERLRRQGRRSWFLGPNSAGEDYFSSRIEPYLRMPDDHSLALARHRIVTTLFAIRRHMSEKKGRPAALADLTPKLLQGIPVDPFSGTALGYEPGTGRLYSVGTNLYHDAGRTSDPPLADELELTAEIGLGE